MRSPRSTPWPPATLRLAITLVASGPGADHALARSRALHPTTRRALLVAANDADGLSTAPTAMSHGLVELVVVKPFREPDEMFHRAITDALYEWGTVRAGRLGRGPGRRRALVGPSHEIRDRLDRNGIVYVFHTADSSAGAAVLADRGADR